jgi:hypothetical protein
VNPAEAWAAVVAGEDAAVYAYSVAGGRVSAGDRARAALDRHRVHRDRAAAQVVKDVGTVPDGSPAYALGPIGTPDQAAAVLAGVENALVGVYADAAAAAAGAERQWAARAAVECAVRAVRWGAAPQAFPTA